eukprot:6341722-Prymnesium_polylepis.1
MRLPKFGRHKEIGGKRVVVLLILESLRRKVEAQQVQVELRHRWRRVEARAKPGQLRHLPVQLRVDPARKSTHLADHRHMLCAQRRRTCDHALGREQVALTAAAAAHDGRSERSSGSNGLESGSPGSRTPRGRMRRWTAALG